MNMHAKTRNGRTVALALCVAMGASGGAMPALADNGDDACEWTLRVADRFATPGRVQGPARLALQRDAGEDTIGVADIATMSSKACSMDDKPGHRYLDYGLEYHLDTNPDAPAERVSAAIAYIRTWSPPSRDSDAPHRTLQLFGKFGRDIEGGRTVAHLGAGFASFPTTRQGVFRRSLLGGEVGRSDDEDPTPLFVYEILPQADYFVGYQPKSITERLDAAYAGGSVKFEWVPFPRKRERLHGLYASAGWTGQHRIAGDDLLPDTYTWTSASIGYRFEQKGANGRSSIAIALDYEKGRSPDNGFVSSEGFVLALKYSLGMTR
jgi:hypothetical protein